MKKALLIATATFAVCGCMKDVRETVNMSPEFTAGFKNVPTTPNVATKTYVDDELHLFWTCNDTISIFTSTFNQQYAFKGRTGVNAGSFKKIDTYEFVTGSPLTTNTAVYPYCEATSISYDGIIYADLPAIQRYAENSFGLGANTMVAVTKDSQDLYLSFQNVCGYLVLRLYGQAKVKSITLMGNNNEKLSGPAKITAAYGQVPVVEMLSSADETILLNCANGVQLGETAQTATSFWFCVPPTTFSQGFKVTITDEEGKTFEKSVTSSKTLSRNVINRMEALEVNFSSTDQTSQYVDLGLTTVWASYNVGATTPEGLGDYYAWGEIETKTDFNQSSYTKNDKYIQTNQYLNYYVFLADDDDVAHAKWAEYWRIPTAYEWAELFENTEHEWVNLKGQYGMKLTSKVQGYTDKYIFLPASGMCNDTNGLVHKGSEGYYWSSTQYLEDTYTYAFSHAQYYGFEDNLYYFKDHCPRWYGMPIRPVFNKGIIYTVAPWSLDFGEMAIGESRTLSFEIKNQGEYPFIVHDVNTVYPFLSVDWTHGTIKPGESQTVNLTCTPTSEFSITEGFIEISFANYVNREFRFKVVAKSR